MNAPIRRLDGSVIANVYTFSNFYYAPLTIAGDSAVVDAMAAINPNVREWIRGAEKLTFNGTEALWQSLKADKKAVFDLFHGDGALSLFRASDDIRHVAQEQAAFLPFVKGRDPHLAQKMRQTWAKKTMVGIIPKLAANRNNAQFVKQLMLSPYSIPAKDGLVKEREYVAPAVEALFWTEALLLKFRSHPVLKEALLATGNDYLLEFSRGAARSAEGAALATHWGGMIPANGPRAGQLLGDNAMGTYVMEVRRILAGDSCPDITINC